VTGIVRDALDELLPESLEDTAVRLNAQRETVRDALAKLNESGRSPATTRRRTPLVTSACLG
jgi:hypothetical protein